MKRIALWLVAIAFLVSFVVSSPAQAAPVIHVPAIAAAIERQDANFICYVDRCVIAVCVDADFDGVLGWVSTIRDVNGYTSIYYMECIEI